MERAELKQLIRSTGVAVERQGFSFLVDAQWGAAERAAAESLMSESGGSSDGHGWLCVPTGGTSGQLRFARHDEHTFSSAVSGFCRHFGLDRVNAVGVLPMHHVSGLMARTRCAATGGTYAQWDWKRLSAGEYPQVTSGEGDWFLSLVPTQLQRLLERKDGEDFLKRFRVVFIGGGPTWPALATAAAEAKVPVALSYGMTETAAMIAVQKPTDFLAGARDVGRPMPHVGIDIVETDAGGGGSDAIGRVRVTSESVFRGYFPEYLETRVFETEDLGRFTPVGTLEILGRRDSGIITGGKKVWPTEVEAALLATGLFKDVAVLGIPDATWGEKVVACYPGSGNAISIDDAKRAVGPTLSAFKQPKQLIPVNPWPRNAQGKLNRAALKEMIRANV